MTVRTIKTAAVALILASGFLTPATAQEAKELTGEPGGLGLPRERRLQRCLPSIVVTAKSPVLRRRTGPGPADQKKANSNDGEHKPSQQQGPTNGGRCHIAKS